jgi:hypothetical protein
MTDFEKAVQRATDALRAQLSLDGLELHGEVSGVWQMIGHPETGVGWRVTGGPFPTERVAAQSDLLNKRAEAAVPVYELPDLPPAPASDLHPNPDVVEGA